VATPLILAPTCAGCPAAPGLRHGPAAVLARLDPAALDVRRPDVGDGTPPALLRAVRPVARRVAAAGDVPIILGGDHTVAVPSVLGVRDGLRLRYGRDVPLFVLWLDAHPDVNTPETSPTGNLHGMVLSGLLGAGPLAVEEPLPAERVVLAGVRQFDPGELAFLQARPEIELWDVETLRGDGWVPAAEALLARVADAGGRLYASLDLDVIDPAYAPGVAVPERHGAHPASIMRLLRRLRESGLLAGADVVELNPPADEQARTAQLAVEALQALGAVGSVASVASAAALAGGPSPLAVGEG
jgi:arginase